MGEHENENGSEESTVAGEAAPTPSLDRPVRHTFILRLIPTFSDISNAGPRWHSVLEHHSLAKVPDTRKFTKTTALFSYLHAAVSKITSTRIKSID